MKIEIGRAVADEVFTSRLVIKSESGLILMTDSFLFKSQNEKEAIKTEFENFINQLETIGVTVVGKEKIKL